MSHIMFQIVIVGVNLSLISQQVDIVIWVSLKVCHYFRRGNAIDKIKPDPS